MMSPMMFAAAVLAGVPALPLPPPAPTGEETRRPSPPQGQGGPYEPVEARIVVEGARTAAPDPFTIAPDPALSRRYAPREREPRHRVVIRF